MDRQKVIELMSSADTDVDFVAQISNALIQDKVVELDNLMREIRTNVVEAPVAADPVIEKYLLQLTSTVYFISTRCETFGFYDDITKANARVKYNEAYAENQAIAVSKGKKSTAADNQLYAETNSADETAVNIIYSRSLKLIKSKLESANEMIRTLSKILSVHMSSATGNAMSRRLME